MADLEPFRVEVLLRRQVLVREEVTHDLDAQQAHRHVAELHAAERDVRDLGAASQQCASVLKALPAVGAAAQLFAGAAHDARDKRLGAHHLECVEDVGEQQSEVDQREDLGDGDARHGHVVDLHL